jgi:hypothetical protein
MFADDFLASSSSSLSLKPKDQLPSHDAKSEETRMSEVTSETYIPKHANDDPEHDAGYPP